MVRAHTHLACLAAALLVIANASAGDRPTPTEGLILWYDSPAAGWTAALPVGNGRLGAMVFGGVDIERIQLNEESMWAGPPVSENAEDLAPVLAEARRLFLAGQPAAGERLVAEKILAERISPRSYQTLGDLHLRMHYPGRNPVKPIEITAWRRGPVHEAPEATELAADFDDAAWCLANPPDDLAVPEHSTVTFRTEFTLTDTQIQGGLCELALSPIDDASCIHLNGEQIARTTAWNRSHNLDVREHLRPGRNTLAIAVTNTGGPGHLAREARLSARSIPQDYRRTLDLDRAVATTAYTRAGVRYSREVFVSAVDDVLVVRVRADKPECISCDLTLARPADFETCAAGDSRLVMTGRVSQNGQHVGVHYAAMADVRTTGGAIDVVDNALRVRDADELVLLLAAKTDYNFASPQQPLPADRRAACSAVLQSASKRVDQLLADHERAHQRLFRRVSLDLGPSPDPDLPTDQRLARVTAGAEDSALAALYFQLGRYLLICSSRPGTMPANLQGIWNEHVEAPWNADYHFNINIQMNYWPAEVANLSECHLPLFKLMEGMLPDGRDLARKLGCRGVAFGHVSDAWLWSAVQGQPCWGMWPMGAGWASAHMMEHYHFTRDATFLRQRAWPFLREAALFYLDWLVEDPRTGLLVSGPTTSPENTYWHGDDRLSLSMGPTMDQQIIRETFENVLTAANLLNIDDEFTANVKQSLARLAPTRIGRDGRLLEWPEEYREAEPGHRHMSHLYGLYPSNQISPLTTPGLAAAASKTLDARLAQGGGHTGWSRAWLVNFGARLLEAEFAHEQVRQLLAKSTLPNLFDTHPPFQIDGNFGGCAGIAEMLLQSHTGEIHLLPALPAAWPTGSVRGLCARGGLLVDIAWKDGRLTQATLRPRSTAALRECRVRYGSQTATIQIPPGGSTTLSRQDFAP